MNWVVGQQEGDRPDADIHGWSATGCYRHSRAPGRARIRCVAPAVLRRSSAARAGCRVLRPGVRRTFANRAAALAARLAEFRRLVPTLQRNCRCFAP